MSNDRYPVSNSMAKFLTSKYRVKGRYILSNELLQDFQIINERFENEKYFSTIKNNSFLIKISKPKCITYFDKYQNKKQVFSPHYFSYKFVRLDRVNN